MEVYFRYEAQDTALDYTRVFTFDADLLATQSSSVGSVLQQFAATYAAKHGRQLNLATAVLCNGNTPIDLSSSVTAVLSRGDDVLVRCALWEDAHAQYGTSAAADKDATATLEATHDDVTSQLKSCNLDANPVNQPKLPQTAAMAASADFTEAVAAVLAAAKQAAAERRYRTAAAACASLLQSQPGHAGASRIVADVLTAAGKPESAMTVLQAALAAAKLEATLQQHRQHEGQLQQTQQQHTGDQQQQQQYVQLLRQLGACHIAAGRLQDALATFQKALRHLGQQDVHLQLDLQALCASALYPRGGAHAEAALLLILEVLDSCKSVPSALRQYAVIAADKQLWVDVVKVTVRLLAKLPDDRQAKQLLAKAVQDSSGMQQLLQDVGSTPESAAALAFLAHIIKEHGAVQQAVQLYRLAVQLQPQSSSYALELAHALELDHDCAEVLQVVLHHCKACEEQSIGALKLQSVAELPSLLEVAEQPFSICTSSWLQCDSSSNSSSWGAVASSSQDKNSHTINETKQTYVAATASSSSSSSGGSQSCEVHSYSPQELDCLALLFTAVKVLFVGGALAAAAELLQLCDGPWQASHEPLHCTLVRNEAAYAGCIKKLLLDCAPGRLLKETEPIAMPQSQMGPAAAAAPAAAPPIFLCGDSHCLSGAWRHITVAGQQRLLHPLLITGLKIWHLRHESQHYAKHQFWAAMAAVPSGSQLVLLLGEIDCREGLLTAVEKLQYDSLQEAAAATVAIYIEVLLQLVQEHGLQVYVHPVPPVLDETRDVVKLFETTLKQALAAAVQQHPQVRGRLVYLDFFARLLSDDKQSLQALLSMDGTHLHPFYLEHFEAALRYVDVGCVGQEALTACRRLVS